MNDLELINEKEIPPQSIKGKENFFSIEQTTYLTYEGINLFQLPEITKLQEDMANIIKENMELKKTNEIFEKEINFLKSLILINNLNLFSEYSYTSSKFSLK